MVEEVKAITKIIYPNYIDYNKKVSEGRRVAKDIAVQSPDIMHMAAACRNLNIPCVVEQDKSYPRDWLVNGRLRVELTDDNGTPYNQFVTTKQKLLEKIATLVPNFASAATSSLANSTVSNQSTTKKKKGKK